MLLKKITLFILVLLLPVLILCGGDVLLKDERQNQLPEHLIFGIPGDSDLLLSRRGFSLGYSQQHKQALWVCYILTVEDVEKTKVRRSNKFKVDPAVLFRPVLPGDYTHTGFDRGHLAPAADMAYSIETMEHSFYMTNISPQRPGCNRGIWKRLESQIRKWAAKEEKICVVTGPLFQQGDPVMGKAEIPVPYAFYKAVLDMTPPMKMIAFIVPNQTSRRRIYSFAVTVDHLEKMTGFDFFSELPDEVEEQLEKEADFDVW